MKYYPVFLSVFLSIPLAFGANFDIPSLPQEDPLTMTVEPTIKNEHLPIEQNTQATKTPSDLEFGDRTIEFKKALSVAPRKSTGQEIKSINNIEKKQLHRFTSKKRLPPKPPLAHNFSSVRNTSTNTNLKKITNTEPLFITSSKKTHNLIGSGLYQNIIVMNENIKQIFSSKKLSVEIRGPIAMLRLTSISGSEIDVQILTESFHVETFVFHINNNLPAQKFIVKSEKEEMKKNLVMKRKTSGGQAIDTLITISNGKKPKGYKWIASEVDRREYMGLGIREIGSYKKRYNEFIVFAITNETTAMISIKEWDLHNSIVLGSVKRARNVKLMSLDDYQIESGKTVIMYVGVHLVKKEGR